MRTRTTLSTGLAMVAIAASALVAPVYADTAAVTDPNESGTPSDTRRVTVAHYYNANGVRGRVVVRARVGNVMLGDRFDLWLDTPAGTARPGYFAQIRPETEYGPVIEVAGWKTRGKASCSRWEARSVSGDDETVTLSIPRACLGNPGRIRVSLRSVYQFNQGVVRDWVPKYRTLTPWVRVSQR